MSNVVPISSARKSQFLPPSKNWPLVRASRDRGQTCGPSPAFRLMVLQSALSGFQRSIESSNPDTLAQTCPAVPWYGFGMTSYLKANLLGSQIARKKELV